MKEGVGIGERVSSGSSSSNSSSSSSSSSSSCCCCCCSRCLPHLGMFWSQGQKDQSRETNVCTIALVVRHYYFGFYVTFSVNHLL